MSWTKLCQGGHKPLHVKGEKILAIFQAPGSEISVLRLPQRLMVISAQTNISCITSLYGGNHQWPIDSPHKKSTVWILEVHIDLSLSMLLSKQSNYNDLRLYDSLEWESMSACVFCIAINVMFHDDVIKWKHFPRYWPFVRGIHRSPVNSPHKGQWRGALMFPLICAWINISANTREAGNLRRHRAHYDVTVMVWNR